MNAKKTIKIVLLSSFLAVFILIIFGSQAKAAVFYVDQQCTFTPNAYRSASGYLIQTFKPLMDRITKIDFEIWGGSGQAITMRLTDTDLTVLTEKTIVLEEVYPPHKVYSVLFDPVTVVPGNTYYIYLQGAPSDGSWAYSDTNLYSDGEAIVGGVVDPGVADFYFITYGYNYSEVYPDPPPNPYDTTDSSDETDSSDDADSSDSEIEKPTEPKAEFDKSSRGVRISWTKSETEDIDGYRIFRSEDKDGDYTEIGTAGKENTDYIDNKNIDEEKTYYYYVRTYKEDTESENSEIVEIETPVFTSEDTEDEKKETDEKSETITKKGKNWLKIGLIAAFIILAGGLTTYFIIKKRKNNAKKLNGGKNENFKK